MLTVLAAVLVAVVSVPALPPLPAVPAAFYRDGKEALDSGDAAAAVRAFDAAAAALEPDAPGADVVRLALGTALLRAGEHTRAVAVLEKSALAGAAAPLGDALRLAGRNTEARAVYARVEGENAAYAKARLAELDGLAAEAGKDFAKAVAFTFEAADAFLKLADPASLDEATRLYGKLARGREWRGEATARAVFSLGEVEKARGRLPEAVAYYQRCFVSWARYPNWAAQSYLRAASAFDALGRRSEAIAHLRELVRKIEKYGKLPEYEAAKKQLRAWGEDVR